MTPKVSTHKCCYSKCIVRSIFMTNQAVMHQWLWTSKRGQGYLHQMSVVDIRIDFHFIHLQGRHYTSRIPSTLSLLISSVICAFMLLLVFFFWLTSHFFIKYYLNQYVIWLLRYWLVTVRQSLFSFKDSVESINFFSFLFN